MEDSVKAFIDLVGRKWGYYVALKSVRGSARRASEKLRKRRGDIRLHRAEALELFLEGQLQADRFKEIMNNLLQEDENLKAKIQEAESPYRPKIRRLNKLYQGLRNKEFTMYQELFGKIEPLEEPAPQDKQLLEPKKKRK